MKMIGDLNKMTLKNWTKDTSGGWIYGTKHGERFIFKKGYLLDEYELLIYPDYLENTWVVEDSGNKNKILKITKTKSSALKFARDYMKKH